MFSDTPIAKETTLSIFNEMGEQMERFVYSDNEIEETGERWVVIDDALFVGVTERR